MCFAIVSATASTAERSAEPFCLGGGPTAMNTTATQAAFSIAPASGGTFTWAQGDTVVVFTPPAALTGGTPYTVSLAASATSAGGAALGVFSFSFTVQGGVTADSTQPTVTGNAPANVSATTKPMRAASTPQAVSVVCRLCALAWC